MDYIALLKGEITFKKINGPRFTRAAIVYLLMDY